jgi:short-subunit dehydrogenase
MTQLVFITGASSGIGQALALRFYSEGFNLALLARRSDAIQDWVRKQSIDPARVRIYNADVANVESVVSAAQQCLLNQGLPDVVIANAGISIGMDTAVRSDLDVMAQIFATNNIGLAATFHPFIDAFCARGSGTLVGIGSVAGIRGIPGHGAYSASKAAVIAYCESLRGELRSKGVTVVTICPGYIDTPLTRQNRYSMPFLMTADSFAAKAYKAIAAGSSYRVIPWQMGGVAALLRLLPNRLFDKVFSGRPRKRRADAS